MVENNNIAISKNTILGFSFLIAVTCSSCLHQQLQELDEQTFKFKNKIEAIDDQVKKANSQISQINTQSRKDLLVIDSKIKALDSKLNKIEGKLDALSKAIGEEQIASYVQEGEDILSNLTDLNQHTSLIRDDFSSMLTELSSSIEKKQANTMEVALQEFAVEVEKLKEQISTIKAPSASKKLASLKQARQAFNDRRYLKLKNEIPQLLPKMKLDTSVEELGFYYAESLFKLGDLSESAISFTDYLKTQPKESYYRKSTLRLGDIYRLFADFETAKIYYQELIEKYPDSQQAKIASTQIEKIQNK